MPCAAVFCGGWWRQCVDDPRSRPSCESEAAGEGVLELVSPQRTDQLPGHSGGHGCLLDEIVEEDPGRTQQDTGEAALPAAQPAHAGRARAKTADIQQIQKDIPRTFFDQPDVLELSSVIEAVLQQYAAADVEVGYCQGMSFVAAVTAFRFRSAETAYQQFWEVVSGIRGLWLPGLPLLLTGVTAFELLCKSCFEDLELCLGANNVNFDMFLPDAWLTLFSRWLPFATLWDSFEFIKVEGFPGVLALTLALLKVHKSALLEAGSFRDMFVLLKELAKQPCQPDVPQLLASARELVPKAHRALVQANDVPQITAKRTNSTLTRCGPCVVHAKSGVELFDCGWPTFAQTLHAVTSKAVMKDRVVEIFTAFRTRSSDTATQASGAASASASCDSIRSAGGRRRGRMSCLCGGKAPREDA